MFASCKKAIRSVTMSQPIIARAYRQLRRIAGRRRLSQLRLSTDIRLVVGASGVCPREWVATDIEYLNLLEMENWAEFFDPDSIEAILAEHVWEHLSREEGIQAASNCRIHLKSGGFLRIAVPDGNHPDPRYIESVEVGGSGAGADDHKVLYDYRQLESTLYQSGFRELRFLEYFDEEGQFHFHDWAPESGLVHRSSRFDPRNKDNPLRYTSLIVDAVKSNASNRNE